MRYLKFLPVAVLSFSLFSCYADPEPGVGTIVVKDVNDFRVPGAEVTLEKQPGIPFDVGHTNENGEYTYTFNHPDTEEAVEVILDITAKKGIKEGHGVIRLKPGETAEEEVIIYP